MTLPSGTAAGLLLAAGAGRRFGGPKALVRLGDSLLVERGIHLLGDGGCAPVVVVLGARAEDVQAAADLSATEVIVNHAWQEGMGSSLRAGLRALGRSAAVSVVVALVDQPLVGPDAVRRLIQAWQVDRPPAAVATYGGQPRNPVLLDRSVWSDVCEWATGDQGARGYLRHVRKQVALVSCDETGSPEDVDTPANLEDLINRPREEHPCS